jgi:phosphatidylglycerol:prolipoprotein diacylglycerol transferase
VHPHLLQFGRLVLPTYGFLLALGAILSLLVSVRIGRLLSLDPDKIWKVAVLAIVTALLGERLLITVSRWPRFGFGAGFTANAIAAVAAGLYALHLGLPPRRTADAFAPSLALSSSVVSIACLEAGCGYGTPTHLPWAVVFSAPAAVPHDMMGVPLHPTQLYAGLVEFALFIILLWLLHRPHLDGEVMGAWLFLAGLSNFLLSFLRGDSGPLVSGLIPAAQLVSAAMVLAGGILWLHRSHHAYASHGG